MRLLLSDSLTRYLTTGFFVRGPNQSCLKFYFKFAEEFEFESLSGQVAQRAESFVSMLGGVSSMDGALASGVYTCTNFRFTIPLKDAASLRMNIVRCCAMINDSAHWTRAHGRILCIGPQSITKSCKWIHGHIPVDTCGILSGSYLKLFLRTSCAMVHGA